MHLAALLTPWLFAYSLEILLQLYILGKIKLDFVLVRSLLSVKTPVLRRDPIKSRAAGYGPQNAVSSFLFYLINFHSKGMLCETAEIPR